MRERRRRKKCKWKVLQRIGSKEWEKNTGRIISKHVSRKRRFFEKTVVGRGISKSKAIL